MGQALFELIERIFFDVKAGANKGELADYIPELSKINPDKFGVYFRANNKAEYGVGNYDESFSIQSIAKVLSLSMAYGKLGESIWSRLGVEPSGTAFNSLVQLESDTGIPRNPFINAGALVICDILISEFENPQLALLNYIRALSGRSDLNYSTAIAESEKSIGYRNIALCNFIKSFGNIKNDPDEVIDLYFNLCSIEMSCKDLSTTFSYLAQGGKNPLNGEQVLSLSQTKRMNALMQTCGFYDESREFSFKVGLPAKSGVGGGIVAIHPGQYSICTWSPRLNKKGNSYRGIQFLEEFTTQSQLSIF